MDIQKANDMLAAMQAQRDQALNSLVYAQAEIMSLRRAAEDLTRALKEAHQERDKAIRDLKDAQDNLTRATTLPASDLAA